ncbi:MAG: bidirectional hydrogenase complex protein HoxE [Cyanobacteria bacterium P01_E01_bin.6]
MTASLSKPVSGQLLPNDKRMRLLEASIKRYQYRADALIEVLHTAQELFGYLEPDLLLNIAHRLQLPPSHVYGVATFYHFFSLTPKGAHTCVVCMGTACYVKGAAQLLSCLERTMTIKAGETTPDDQFSLMTARCLGACGVAPVIVLDDQLEGHQTCELAIERLTFCLSGEDEKSEPVATTLESAQG